jgi:hypothetical protein
MTTSKGRIWIDGRVAAEVSYEIATSKPERTNTDTFGKSSDTAGFSITRGRIIGTFDETLVGKPVELELENGSRWRCFIRPNGELVNMA